MADAEATGSPQPAPESLEFRAEIRQLLNILAHSLYTEREIFLRELISNASDALNRLRFEQLTNQDILDPDAELAIRITVDQDARIVRISDTGIGMTREELIENLGTIAHSGAMSFLTRLEQDPKHGADIIGQFGVGFYSVFMVADEVRVISRSYRPDAEAVEWVTRGENTYTVGPANKATRGTTVELTLREDAAEFANTWRLESIIRKHSDFIAFPIYVGDSDKPVNRQTAPWRRAPREVTEEQYTEFYKQLTFDPEPPLSHIHLVTDAPVQVRALVYIPRHREQGMLRLRTEEGLQLYSHNVLIQEYSTDLLPKHFRFVTGVVDSEDLPLNISRETVQMQSNRVMERIRNLLTKRVQGELERLAADAPDDYRTFWTAFSVYLKEGVATDPGAREPLARLLRYPSSATSGDELTSLQAYVDRMQPEQDAIYYVLADDQRSAAASPHLDPFKARGLEVLYFVEPIDNFVAVSLTEFAGKQLRNADDPDISLPPLDEAAQAAQPEPLSGADFAPLLLRVREVLGDRVLEVREGKTLTASPCRLVSPPGADRDLQRVRRYLDQQYEVPKKILELNRSSPLIQGLAARVQANPADSTVDLIIEQLYDSALLQEGLHPNPADMVGRIQQLMEAAVGGAGARPTPTNAAAPTEPEAVASDPAAAAAEPAATEVAPPQVITGEVITEE
ncbi:MAG TPA: molecular chaperone HtpG [Chloroflexia bacterium]|jgi:molecular chaperone HtpG|nr:molecular chaperone HtpG [Chloroflexia bacterium]